MSVKMLYILNVAEKVNNFSYSAMIAAQNLGIEFSIAGNWGYPDDAARIAAISNLEFITQDLILEVIANTNSSII